MSALIVIPARWGSTRFPGKPLALLRGRSLLHRVIAVAQAAARLRPDTPVMVATDDQRIVEHAQEAGCPAVMTDPAISSGTGRALAAARDLSPVPARILNLQGDTPFVTASILIAVLDALAGGDAVATAAVRLGWDELDMLREHKRHSPFSGTTCVSGSDGYAHWFSKQIIPAIRDEEARRASDPQSPVRRHLGVYGYSLKALERFEAEPPSPQEELEGLEQLRLFALGIPIRVVPVTAPPISMNGIDTPADLERACRLLDAYGEPFLA